MILDFSSRNSRCQQATISAFLIIAVIVFSISVFSNEQYFVNIRLQKELGSSHVTGPSYSSRVKSPRSFLGNCKCQSMFTIGACGMAEVAAMKENDSHWVSATEGLMRARTSQENLMMPHLKTFARYLPQLFTFNITPESNTSTMAATANAHISRAMEYMPFVPCHIHVYTPSEVNKCSKKILLDTGKPLRIAFVGDSRVRNTMQQMIRSTIPAMQYKLAGDANKGNITVSFLNQKSKYNVPVKGDGLELRLFWSAYLDLDRNPEDISQQGAKDLLETWASGNSDPEGGPIPDIAYITSGLWDTSMLPEDLAAESFISTLEKMTPILKALAERTRVIWHVHGPIKDWLATRDIPNGAIDIMNRASWHWLNNSNIWLWDTHTVMMLRELAECRYLSKSALHKQTPNEWGCDDFQHAGRDVEDAATNMIWNLVCNSVLELSSEYCCS